MTDKERSEQVAKVMERVCDLCVHPVQATDQDELYDICESCTVATALWDALRNAENQTIDAMTRGIAKAMKQILVNQEGEKR